MANLTTLFACLAANQLAVASPGGPGTIHSVSLIGSAGPLFAVDLATSTGHFSAEQLTPILAGFVAFRAAALRNDNVPKIAVQMLANAVAGINVHGKHTRRPMLVAQALDAELKEINPRAIGDGRFNWDLQPFWNPTGQTDPRQWQPVTVPGLAHFLLCHGYAAGLPAEDWITVGGANFFKHVSKN